MGLSLEIMISIRSGNGLREQQFKARQQVLGHAPMDIVEEVGSSKKNLKRGDRVVVQQAPSYLPHGTQGVRPMRYAVLVCGLLLCVAAPLSAADYPAPKEDDFVLKEFRFQNGDTLQELSIHYRTLGEPRRDDKGVVRNAVLILHGTTGNGANFIRPEFAGELFGKGQLLDATRYYLILPDGIGH